MDAALGEPFAKVFDKQNTERSLTPKTIKNYVSFISSVFDYAVKIKAIKESPCKNAVIPKIPQKEHKMFTPINSMDQFGLSNLLHGVHWSLLYFIRLRCLFIINNISHLNKKVIIY